MERKDLSGFTLIELLIVLAVIAVLTAILFPGIASTREKARQAACLSNLHQIALASELYAEDHDDTFLWDPPEGGTPGAFTSAQIARRTGRERSCADQPCVAWTELLEPYLRNWAVLRCPSFPASVSFVAWGGLPVAPGSGYGLNAVLLGDECEPHTLASLVHSPSDVALVGDSALPRSGIWLERAPASPWPSGWADAVTVPELDAWPRDLPLAGNVYWGWELNPDRAPGWSPELHGGGSNFAFADGHAHFLRPSSKVILVPPSPALHTTVPGPPPAEKAGSFPGALLE